MTGTGYPSNPSAARSSGTGISPPLSDPQTAKDFFHDQGFLTARGLIPAELCQPLSAAFLDEVKPFAGPILRQTTTRPEKHNFNASGLMTNPILNLHELDAGAFPGFIERALAIVCHPNLTRALAMIMDDEPVLVQSMYFESSRGTDPHFDSPFLDSGEWGSLIGCWVALEDISEESGRFLVYPQSHRFDRPGAFPVPVYETMLAYGGHSLACIREYQLEGKRFSLKQVRRSEQLFQQLVETSGMTPHAPVLKRGDVVFFSSKTIHGSYAPKPGGESRHSVTAHFVPRTKGFVRFHQIEETLNLKTINGTSVHLAGLGAVAGGHGGGQAI